MVHGIHVAYLESADERAGPGRVHLRVVVDAVYVVGSRVVRRLNRTTRSRAERTTKQQKGLLA